MKILNFGSCNIDYVYRVENFVKPGETLRAKNFSKFPGGKGLNQSIAIAKSGAYVYHAGCIGTDGMFLKDIMEEAHVDTSYLKILEEATGHAIIQVEDSGENNIILYGGANERNSKEYIDDVLSKFSVGDILVLQNEINHLEYIIDCAYERGMKIILNPSPFRDELNNIDYRKLAYLILNEVEAREISSCETVEKMCEFFRRSYSELNVVLTLGRKGSVYLEKGSDSLIYCPAYMVDAVDTTAAGDTFTGYFISGILEEADIEANLKRATAAAALAVSKEGASSSIPVKEDVLKALTYL